MSFVLAPNVDLLVSLAVTLIKLDDTLITASSEKDVNFAAKKVILSNHFDPWCGWRPADDDHLRWVQFDMKQDVTVWGVVVKAPCNVDFPGEKVTSFEVVMSGDEVKWSDVSGILSPNYEGETAYCWFDGIGTARWWRIYVLGWLNHPTVKADLIGEMP